jgi:predicted transposase/invertase (TIGR01784 family)
MGALARKIKEEGKAEGKAEKTKEIVKCMLNAGSDIQFISKVTGLSDKEINELK